MEKFWEKIGEVLKEMGVLVFLRIFLECLEMFAFISFYFFTHEQGAK